MSLWRLVSPVHPEDGCFFQQNLDFPDDPLADYGAETAGRTHFSHVRASPRSEAEGRCGDDAAEIWIQTPRFRGHNPRGAKFRPKSNRDQRGAGLS